MTISEEWRNTTDLQLDGEEWRDIKGYEGIYQVSNLGRIKVLDHLVNAVHGSKRMIKGKIHKICEGSKSCNYLTVNLQHHPKLVHRLVAEAFIPNPNSYTEINHKDENTYNNCVDNLEWCTREYNCNYGNHSKNASISQSSIIIAVYPDGHKQQFRGRKEVAKYFNTSPMYVSHWITGYRNNKDKIQFYKKGEDIA